MAVYTHLPADTLERLIDAYDVGKLRSAKGIAEGVSNSNWLIETDRGRFILTMYERRIELDDLPYFLGLLDHLSERACPVPRTIHDRDGAAFRMVGDKAVALIEFLPGVSIDTPTATQAYNVGAALAQMHLAALDFPLRRANGLDIATSQGILASCGNTALSGIDPALPSMVDIAARLQARWPDDLPRSTCHTDLFPDNVLMLGEQVSGMIDFYFACEDTMAYDLAVTHAAWSFGAGGHEFNSEIGSALVNGYQSLRALDAHERQCLPVLAQGACMRFIASRAEDWIDTPDTALVNRKDPMDFARRLQFYTDHGADVFGVGSDG